MESTNDGLDRREFMRNVAVAITEMTVGPAAISSSLAAGAASVPKALAGLSEYIERVRVAWKNVGAAVAVVQGTELIFARGFGVRELGKTVEVDADTLFQVGSTSKAFTTAAVGVLVDEGKIRWDDPIADYVPEFRLRDPWLTRQLTLRDAAAHRTGVNDDSSYYPFLAVMNSAAALGQLRYAEAEAQFRNSYRYNNLMYAALGKAIEATSRMSWHDFIRQRLLQPLNMNRSGASPYDFWGTAYVAPTFLGFATAGHPSCTSARDGNVAMPHARDERGEVAVLPWQSYDNAAAAGSVVSSAVDMAKWLVLHLNEGRFGGRQLLEKETIRELHAPQNPCVGINEFPWEETQGSYALGWFRATFRGQLHLSHTGGIVGFPAYVALLPEREIGVVVLSNGGESRRSGFHHAIEFGVLDRLLRVGARDWSGELLKRAAKTRRELDEKENELLQARILNTSPSLRLNQYAGLYQDSQNPSGRLSLDVEKGRLRLSFEGEGAYCATLEHWHHDVFRLRSTPGVADVLGPRFAVFALDASGKIGSLHVFDAMFQQVAAGGGEGTR